MIWTIKDFFAKIHRKDRTRRALLMLNRLVAARDENGFKQDDIVMWRRDDGAWMIEAKDDHERKERREKMRRLPSGMVLLELFKTNAIITGWSIANIYTDICRKNYRDDGRYPDYRPVRKSDLRIQDKDE
jgi:hypothetical protein